jgi:Protein of unknown function (DUF2510)
VTALPAGWYGDPADSTRYRYWDGGQWTTHVQNRAEVDIAAAEADMAAAARPLPDFDDPGGTASGATTGRRRVPILLAVVALAAIAGAAAFVVTSGGGDSGQTLAGEVRVGTESVRGGGEPDDGAAGDGCGTGSAQSIGAGSALTVSNARGEVLGRTELQAGRLDRTPTATTCVFPYEVTGVDDAAVYLVQVAERRPTRTTRAQVEADRGRIDVLLG